MYKNEKKIKREIVRQLQLSQDSLENYQSSIKNKKVMTHPRPMKLLTIP